MTAFLISAALLLLAVLVLLVWPLLRRPAAPEQVSTESPALKVLREQRSELESERVAGRVSDETYTQTLLELERRTLEEAGAPEAPAPTPETSGARHVWAAALVLLVPVVAGGLYLQLGNPDGLDPSKTVAQQSHMDSQQIEAMIQKLAARVQANPDDIEGTRMLARTYMVLERFPEAVKVLEALSKRVTDDAQLYADWADALGSVQGGSLQGAPEKLIARALEIDPKQVKALALAGTVAFDRKDFKGALKYWEPMAALVDPNSEFGRSVRSMINDARANAGLPALPEVAQAPAVGGGATAPHPPVGAMAETGGQAPQGGPDVGTLKLAGRLELDPALKGSVSPDDTLFVFVRPAAGGPPLSGLRFKASELPLNFDFAKAPLMMATGSLPDQVIVGARISKSGDVKATPGDLQGFSQPVAPNTQNLALRIAETVK